MTWRGIRCVNVEPWTSYPARLDEAIAADRAMRLAPGEALEATARWIGFATRDHVRGFDEAGAPVR